MAFARRCDVYFKFLHVQIKVSSTYVIIKSSMTLKSGTHRLGNFKHVEGRHLFPVKGYPLIFLLMSPLLSQERRQTIRLLSSGMTTKDIARHFHCDHLIMVRPDPRFQAIDTLNDQRSG